MFCEKDNLQILCHSCHKVKSDDEKARAKVRRDKAKGIIFDDDSDD
jgi:5-methylcytosine-specific restriction endonuclease McrA